MTFILFHIILSRVLIELKLYSKLKTEKIMTIRDRSIDFISMNRGVTWIRYTGRSTTRSSSRRCCRTLVIVVLKEVGVEVGVVTIHKTRNCYTDCGNWYKMNIHPGNLGVLYVWVRLKKHQKALNHKGTKSKLRRIRI